MRRIDLTGYVIGDFKVVEYLGNKKYSCLCKCGATEVKLSDSLRKGYACKCTHNKEYSNIIGTKFNDWEVIDVISESIYKCRCTCGNVRDIKKYDLEHGASKSCGHDRLIDLTGMTIGEWQVLKYAGDKKWTCQCSCGRIRNITGYTLRTKLKNNEPFSCGHVIREDLSNTKFADWTVLYYVGNYKWHCRCSCGKESDISEYSLLSGGSKSCGHAKAFIDLTGQHIGELDVLNYIGNQTFLCKCSCGKIVEKSSRSLRSNPNQSCGHVDKHLNSIIKNSNREDWQIDTILDRDKLIKFIGDTKPSPLELAEKLGISYSHAIRIINKLDLNSLVSTINRSYMEDELFEYIRGITPQNIEVYRGDRHLLKGKELDIYIPDKKLAIEFNGSYWHSNLFKGVGYHQSKTVECGKQGVHLIHVFEYEWLNPDKKSKILHYLSECINGCETIYARNTYIRNIDSKVSAEFLNKYHLQCSAKSSIQLGMYHRDELIGVMTLGVPRFNTDYQYEIIRLCYKAGIKVIGGTSKLLKYFIRKYNPESIITYADLSKFTGLCYTHAGFKPIKGKSLTTPNYMWVNLRTQDSLSRYQTQKSKLIANGLGTDNDTENTIMEDLGYVKIYDCGNLKYEWIRDNKQEVNV